MSTTLPSLDHLASLAAIELDSSESAALTEDLEAIIRYVEQLQAVPTEGVPPMTAVGVGASAERIALREDAPREGLSHEEALANAPASAEGGFSVPTFVGS